MASPNITVQVKGGTTRVLTGPTGGATRLVELLDVTAVPRANGDVLTYISANGKFEFHAQTGGTGGSGGGGSVVVAQFSSNVNQFPANTSPSAITYDSHELIQGIGHTLGDSKVYTPSAGAYFIVTGIQVGRTLGGGEGVRNYDYWLRLNGVDVANSTVRAALAEVADTIVLVDNFILEMQAGDYIEVIQAVQQAGLGMGAYRIDALAGGPVVPSIIFTMMKVAGGSNSAFSNVIASGQNTIFSTTNTNLTLVAGSNMTITTNNINNSITFSSTGGTANISNTAPINYNVVSGIISHATSGVTASGYGDAITVPKIVVDDKGHVTSVVNTAISFPASLDQFARDQANSAFNKANTANVTGQAAFDKANSAIYTAAQIRANLSNTAPVNYDASTGIISHALSGVTATTFGNTTFVPTITVDDKGHVTSASNTAIAFPAIIDQFARDNSNGAFAKANSANVTGQAAFDKANSAIYTAAQIRANISNTAPINYDPTTGVISHNTSGVIAGTYGAADVVGRFTVDSNGHITAAANDPISIDASAIATGTLTPGVGGTGNNHVVDANGLVFIGNTISGLYDVNTLTQGTGIVITNAPGSITIAATGGSAIDQFARDHGNGAFDKANSAIYTAAQIRANISNTAPINYDATTGIVSHADSGVAASGYGNSTTVPKVVVDAKGHITSVTNTSISGLDAGVITTGTLVAARGGTGQTAITINGAVLIANTLSNGYDLNTLTQGTGILITNDKGSITIAATGGSSIDQFARDHGNGAFDKANSAIYTAAQIRANISNTAPINYDATTGIISHADSGATASGYGDDTTIPKIVVDVKGHVTSVTNTAVAISAASVTSGILAVARGGTGKDATGLVNGSLLIGNTVNTGFDLTTIAQTAPVIVVNGKGTITLSHASSGVTATGYGSTTQIPVFVVDAFGHITSVTNTSISGLDAGVITTGTLVVARGGTGQSTYTNGQILIGNTSSTGLDKAVIAQSAPVIVTNLQGSITISHARSGVVAVDSYGSPAIIPVLAIDANGHITAAVNTAVAISAAAVTSGILSVARGGTGKDATGLANGQLLIGNTVNTGFDLTTIAQTAPVIVVNGKGTITLSHASSGVVATGYGTATQIPVFVVDAFGHVTAVTNTAIAGLDAGVITTGTLVVARGGTGQSTYTNGQILIGNTGSTGLDKAVIAQSAPVIVTNLQGSITISHARSTVVPLDSYGSQSIIPVLAVDANGHLTAVVNTAIGGLGTGVLTTGILPVARGGTGKDATGLTNGQILIANTVNTGFDLAGITQTAPVIVSTDKGSIRLSHARSGVTAATYGSASLIPVITVDDNGHITTVTTAAPSGLPPATANGQTLIGNTVSGSFDVALIAQTAPIIVTNGKGTINLSHASSGVVAGTYGNGTFVPVLTVDTYGHITVGAAAAITGTGAIIKQTELVFGTTPVDEKSFTVTDASVTATTLITGSVAYKAPTGKDLDEVEMDSYSFSFAPGTGQFTTYVKALDGYVTGNVFLNYTLY